MRSGVVAARSFHRRHRKRPRPAMARAGRIPPRRAWCRVAFGLARLRWPKTAHLSKCVGAKYRRPHTAESELPSFCCSPVRTAVGDINYRFTDGNARSFRGLAGATVWRIRQMITHESSGTGDGTVPRFDWALTLQIQRALVLPGTGTDMGLCEPIACCRDSHCATGDSTCSVEPAP